MTLLGPALILIFRGCYYLPETLTFAKNYPNGGGSLQLPYVTRLVEGSTGAQPRLPTPESTGHTAAL